MNVRVDMPEQAELVLSSIEVAAGYDRLADQLQARVDEGNVVLLAVMNGGLVPLARLMDRLRGDYGVDYCHPSRYRDGVRGGELRWIRKPDAALAGRQVIVVDDIFDEGATLEAVVTACREVGAAAVWSAVAFVKSNPRRADVTGPDYCSGLEVPDRFVFGCGMDMAGRWRHLDGVFALAEPAP